MVKTDFLLKNEKLVRDLLRVNCHIDNFDSYEIHKTTDGQAEFYVIVLFGVKHSATYSGIRVYERHFDLAHKYINFTTSDKNEAVW